MVPLSRRSSRIFHPFKRYLVFLQKIKRKSFLREIENIEMISKPTMRWCWISILRNWYVDISTEWIFLKGIYIQWHEFYFRWWWLYYEDLFMDLSRHLKIIWSNYLISLKLRRNHVFTWRSVGRSHTDINYDIVAYRIFIKGLVQTSYILRIKVYRDRS